MRAIIHSGKDGREAVTGLQVKDINIKGISEINHSHSKSLFLYSCLPPEAQFRHHSSNRYIRKGKERKRKEEKKGKKGRKKERKEEKEGKKFKINCREACCVQPTVN